MFSITATTSLRSIFIALLFLPSLLFSQDYYELLKMSDKYREKGNLEEAILYNINSLKHHSKTNNTDFIVTAYTNIGGILCTRNQYNKSFFFLDLANKKIDDIQDPIVKSRLYSNYGRNYSALELFEQSNLNFDKSIEFALKSKDPKKKLNYLFYGYYGKWDNFEKMNIKDSVYYLQKKNIELFPNEPLVYDKIASRYIKNNIHLDSAQYYVNKALILSENHNVLMKAAVLTTYGNLCIVNKDYEKALDYYQKTLDIYLKLKHEVGIFNCYKLISQTYAKLEDKKNETKYLEKYTVLKDSITITEKKVYNTVLQKFITEKEEKENAHRQKLYFLIILIVVLAILGIYYIRKIYIKKQKYKDELLFKKSSEADELKKRINITFDEINQLAKTGDPFFLIRFKEVYPEFYQSLLTYSSELTESDIKFAAFLRLNLTNKEIALYDNISLRSVEMKKYRLKKKLGLSSETDFNKWVLEL